MEAHRRYADWRSSCEAGVLDDGISNRMAKSCIKGFGNAIVPEVAAQFVMAASEILTANAIAVAPPTQDSNEESK